MANAGGGTDLDPGTVVRFTNSGTDGPVPDAGPIQAGLSNAHQPGGAYAPASRWARRRRSRRTPRASTRSTASRRAASGGSGSTTTRRATSASSRARTLITADRAVVRIRRSSRPTANPLVSGSAVRAPRSHVDATPRSGTRSYWRNVVNGEFYDAGPFIAAARHRTSSMPTCPLKHGTNIITTYRPIDQGERLALYLTPSTCNELRVLAGRRRHRQRSSIPT